MSNKKLTCLGVNSKVYTFLYLDRKKGKDDHNGKYQIK